MFHVEQQQTHIKTKDFLVSKEEFVIAKTSYLGLLKTLPSPSKDKIHKYYKSDRYTSHHSQKTSIFNFIYRTSRKLNLFFKKKHLNLNSCKNLLDFGSGDGFFIQSISKSNIHVFGVEPVLPTKSSNVFKQLSDVQKKRTSIQHNYGVAFFRAYTRHPSDFSSAC